jgi:hypothetical protein
MERRRILRAGLCLWGLAQPLSAAAPTETQTVCVRAAGVDLVRLGPLTVEVMIRELDHLLAVAGTRVEWHWAAAGTETAPDELQVVFLDSPGRRVAGQPLLGSTATGQSGPSPVIWIYCPSVVRTLGLRADSLRGSFFDKRTLGVALGRVVAHELVHALAPEVPHGSGLMAPGFRPEALLGPGLALDVSSATRFNTAVRSLERRGDSPPPDERRARERIAAER